MVTVTAPGLYEAGDSLSAQFMSGTALTLAPAGWGGGWGAILSVPALVGGCGLLTVAGLAGRLLGPRWAPAAAAALALTQPMLLTARSTYSEPVAQLLLLAGACLLLDAVRARSRALAALAGLLIGLNLLVRIDALRELALVVLVVAWLALRRHPGWWPLALGVLAGAAYGVVDAFGPAQPYLSDLLERMRPAVAAILGVVLLAAVAVPVGRRVTPWLMARPWWSADADGGGLGRRGRRRRGAGLAGCCGRWCSRGAAPSRRGSSSRRCSGSRALPVDGHRNYAEQSVRWTSWYVGWPVLVAGRGGRGAADLAGGAGRPVGRLVGARARAAARVGAVGAATTRRSRRTTRGRTAGWCRPCCRWCCCWRCGAMATLARAVRAAGEPGAGGAAGGAGCPRRRAGGRRSPSWWSACC